MVTKHYHEDFIFFIYLLYKGYKFHNGDDLGIFYYFKADYSNGLLPLSEKAKKLKLIQNFDFDVLLDCNSEVKKIKEDDTSMFFLMNNINNIEDLSFNCSFNTNHIEKYIFEYLNKWQQGELKVDYYSNYYKTEKQISIIMDLIYKYHEDFSNNTLNLDTSENNHLEKITVMIFLSMNEIIDIQQVIYENGYINFTFIINDNKFKECHNVYSLNKKEDINNQFKKIILPAGAKWNDIIWQLKYGTHAGINILYKGEKVGLISFTKLGFFTEKGKHTSMYSGFFKKLLDDSFLDTNDENVRQQKSKLQKAIFESIEIDDKKPFSTKSGTYTANFQIKLYENDNVDMASMLHKKNAFDDTRKHTLGN